MPVDKRADMWTLGAMPYDMLTGQKPFAGGDVSTTLARVIERDDTVEATSAEAHFDQTENRSAPRSRHWTLRVR